MLAVGIGALQFVLDKGQEADWFASHLIIAVAIASAAALIGLVVRELTTEHPVVDLRVFKERSYAVGVMMITIFGFVLYASSVLLPNLLQNVFGYPPLQAGMAMMPRGLGSMIGFPLVGLVVGRFDARKLLAAGFITIGASMLWLGHIDLQAGYWDVFWPQMLQGVGSPLLFVPLTTITMAAIGPERMGNATSLFNLMRNIGGSIGIALTGTLLVRREQSLTAIVGSHVSIYDRSSQAMLARMQAAFVAAGADVVTASHRAEAAVFGVIQRQAAMLSFIAIFQLLGIVTLAVVPLVLFMKRPARQAGPIAVH
jgi:DHA2 family multidrug resistance protein